MLGRKKTKHMRGGWWYCALCPAKKRSAFALDRHYRKMHKDGR